MKSNKRTQRLWFVSLIVIFIVGLVGIVVKNFRDNIVFFYAVSELDSATMSGKKIRVGGLVKDKSISYLIDGTLSFVLTDNKNEIKILYKGIQPDLFREGQGVVAEGVFENQEAIVADIILAKHDEEYRPPKNEKQ